MGLGFSQPNAADAILEHKHPFILPNPHSSSNGVRNRLLASVAALLKSQEDAGEAEGCEEEATAMVKAFADAFGGPDAQQYRRSLLKAYAGIFRTKNTTAKQRVISFAQRIGERYRVKFDQAFASSIYDREAGDLRALNDAVGTITSDAEASSESLVDQLSTAYACPIVEVENALKDLLQGLNSSDEADGEASNANAGQGGNNDDANDDNDSGGLSLDISRRDGFEIFLDTVFAGAHARPPASPKARHPSPRGQSGKKRVGSPRSRHRSPRRPRTGKQQSRPETPQPQTVRGADDARYAAAFECVIVCDNIHQVTKIVQNISDGAVEGLKVVSVVNNFQIGNEESVLRGREVGAHCVFDVTRPLARRFLLLN